MIEPEWTEKDQRELERQKLAEDMFQTYEEVGQLYNNLWHQCEQELPNEQVDEELEKIESAIRGYRSRLAAK